MIRIVLPYPPSVNHAYRRTSQGGVPRTYLSKDGKDFKTDVARAVMIARSNGDLPRDAIAGRCRYTLTLFPPNRRRRDISNAVKICEDAITTAGVWVDDEQVDELTIKRGPVHPGGCAVIEIEEIGRD